MSVHDLIAKEKLHAEKARAIHDKAKAEGGRDLTDDEFQEFNSEIAQADKFKTQHESLAKLEKLEAYNKESAGRISQPQELHKDVQRYSVVKAIRDVVEFGQVRGLEREVSDEIARASGKSLKGNFFMPMQTFNLDTSTGAGLVETIKDFSNFIELLRSKMTAQTVGATVLSDLYGNIQLPRQSGGGTAYWIAANGSNTITSSNQTSDYAGLAQKTVGAQTTYTRQMLKQTSMDVEAFVQNDLATVVALELDRVGFAGSGSGAVPEGILYNSDVTTVALGSPDGGAPTWAKMVEMETAVAAENADIGKLAYVTTPQGRGKMKSTVAASSTAKFIWADDNTINGYSAYASNQLPHDLTKGSYGTGLSSAIFGNFADLIYGLWGGLDILVNPYTGDAAGSVRITALQDADVCLRHPESFSIIVDMATS